MAKMKGVVVVNTERCKVNQKGYNYVQQVVEDTCNGCSSCAIVCPDGCLTVYRAKCEE